MSNPYLPDDCPWDSDLDYAAAAGLLHDDEPGQVEISAADVEMILERLLDSVRDDEHAR